NCDKNAATEIARGLAMHTVGMQSGWVDAKDIPQEVIDRELDIYRTQAQNEGKPAEAIEKMLPGKVKKFAKDNCLLEQPTIKDNKKTVADYLAEESKKLGCELSVVRFVRFEFSAPLTRGFFLSLLEPGRFKKKSIVLC
ncbi:MAG: hypothetical protein IKO35_00695, partial [Elusimicrobiaceae bacterium]|nr:hypothetical protein [Elusimicrobiaceae bacterium]